MKLHTRVMIGLLAGAAAGIAANLGLGGEHAAVAWLNKYVAGPVGQVFLRLLFMIVMPLVFASIALGVAGIGDVRKVGRIGSKTLGFFVVTTAIAAAIGLVLCELVRPGERLDPAVRAGLLEAYAVDAGSKIEAAGRTGFGIDTLVNIVTRNPIRSAAEGDMLGVIFFSLIFGAAVTLVRADRAATITAWLDAVNEVMTKIVSMAMRLAPYGVAGLIFGVTSRFGFSILGPLGLYVGVVLGGLALHGVVVLGALVKVLVGLPPGLFFSRIREALVTAFSTSSSSATLPTSIAVGRRNLGVPQEIAGFVYPLGATLNMHGTALFEGVTVIFLAQVFGIDLSLGQMIIVVAMAVLTAIGTAGVPGGSIPLLVGILAMLGIPPEGIAIVLGVDRILDMARTAVNILGDHVTTVWIARSEGAWTPASVPAAPGTDEKQLDETP
jgi:DAACS family dicarboxylate/amino acid:cation (Na+ or H+) symporter